MKFEVADGWMVSTPIYVGDAAAVAKAQKCVHRFDELPAKEKKTDPASGELIEMAIEACGLCVARRAKYRKAVVDGERG